MVTGNSMTDVAKETIDSLVDGPESKTTGMPSFNFEPAYIFASTRTQLTPGSQIEDIAQPS